MIEILVALALSFGSGWYVAHENPTVSCLDQPLITTNCIHVEPPINDTFGATANKLLELKLQYDKCSAAAHASVK